MDGLIVVGDVFLSAHSSDSFRIQLYSSLIDSAKRRHYGKGITHSCHEYACVSGAHCRFGANDHDMFFSRCSHSSYFSNHLAYNVV